MRFALVGNETEGAAMARALAATGRHELLFTAGTALESVKQLHDLEEILADPAVEMVLIASSLTHRAAHLRRALQSERTVCCLHPADTRPDGAYEAGMIQQDTRQVLLALMPDAFHPAILRLKVLLSSPVPAPALQPNPSTTEAIFKEPEGRFRAADGHPGISRTAVQVLERGQSIPHKETLKSDAPSFLGELVLLESERWSCGEVLQAVDVPDALPCLPGWDVLRALGGEIAEVSALSPGEKLEGGTAVVMTGRFEKAGLLQSVMLPHQRQDLLRLRLIGTSGSAELLFPLGYPGPAFLSWRGADGELREENWDAWDPWPTMADLAEDVFAPAKERRGRTDGLPLSWQDAVRCLELDDAARRSVQKRRVSIMEYPEASEEVTFKGTMTLVGCALLWVIIFMVVLSRWVKPLGWFVGPLLGVFLFMQLFRWIIPPRDGAKKETKP